MNHLACICSCFTIIVVLVLLSIFGKQSVLCDYASDCLTQSGRQKYFHGTKCYIRRVNLHQQKSADEWCLSQGKALMAPGTLMKANDFDVVNAVFDAMGLTNTYNYYVGGRQRGTYTEPDGGWMWYNNITQPSEPFDGNEQWLSEQPNNYLGEDCVVVRASDRLLRDKDCNTNYRMICEHDTCNYEMRIDTAGALSTQWNTDVTITGNHGLYRCLMTCSRTRMCQAFTFMPSNNTCRMHWPPHGHGCEKVETSVGSWYGFILQ